MNKATTRTTGAQPDQTPLDSLVDRYVDPIELFRSTLEAASKLADIEIHGEEGVAKYLEEFGQAEPRTPQEFVEFSRQLAEHVRIVRGGSSPARFTIEFQFKPEAGDHQPGQGGTARTMSTLMRDGKPVIRSTSESRYTTSFDDAEDYPVRRRRLTVLAEPDDLGVGIFAALREPGPARPK